MVRREGAFCEAQQGKGEARIEINKNRSRFKSANDLLCVESVFVLQPKLPHLPDFIHASLAVFLRRTERFLRGSSDSV